ncbi:rRNA maturation RNase YbeY [Helicobacter anseris]|uniref:Endoribonuclease YbeY n=1 Tax=Helicobacter anseris TaxID=375926 RepID=A0A3D8J9S7_9HELI|nr:rRNA maturation RNase YbeY [Helicobacter anseris]RDU74050.1 rRNA maturation RNase YbeY [Helicobacter anseris]
MLEIDNQTSIDIKTDFLQDIAKEMSFKDIELLIVQKDFIQELNKTYRNQDKPTDVLSFPLQDMGADTLLGSIVICIEIAQQQAQTYHHTLQEEIALLLIHGILHLLGFDHEKDNGEHREVEQKWIHHFKLPESLIVRNQ